MFNLDGLSGAAVFGNSPGTGPFGFLFSDGQLAEVLRSLLVAHSAALIAIVGLALLAGFIEKRSKVSV